jgi:DNA-binding NtrC family response regulator
MAVSAPNEPETLVQRGGPSGGGGSAADKPPRHFVLTVASGPDSGRRFAVDPIHAFRILIGQSDACVVKLSDRQVSRRHAALEPKGAVLRLFDLDSTNGTFVDRVRVYEADLNGGELIRVGSTTLRVDEADPEASRALSPATAFGRLIGESPEMRRLYPLCAALSASDVPVILEGETGTGKEALAEALHEEGPRASGPFVVFDCAAVSASLLESELFGHERGAFTGAVSARKGVFEQAHGGTLLIDEIGDLDLSMQPKLLRAIERSEIRRVGGDQWIHVDVRVLAATRRDLDREVEAGRFRDDLFHRLAVTRIELPPLRSRRGDVSVLAMWFWNKLGGDPARLSPDLLHKWEGEKWPGNVRELRNALARQLAIGGLAQQAHAEGSMASVSPPPPDALDAFAASGLSFPQARDRILEAFTERYVARVLASCGGDIARAAASSGIGRRYFEKLRARTPR